MSNSVDTLLEITKRNLKAYGEEVVGHRAIPDYRDGLKPVHRYLLWACYQLGIKHGTPFKKAARIVGETIGKFSPHGDGATYQAMVGLTGVRGDDNKAWVSRNSCVPLIEGYGNWGDNLDNAAAYRYTEARLSEFSTKYLLDPIYLAVSDYVPNFSGDEKVPLVLPAKLPALLLNGSASIAFGVAAECPSFEAKGVLDLVMRCLKGEEITPALCAKTLKFKPVYGGECVSDNKDILAFHKHGAGSLLFLPSMDLDDKKRTVTLTSACPGLSSKTSFNTLMERLSQMREVRSVADASDRHGFKFEITSERSIDFPAFADLVEDTVIRKYSYNIGITIRTADSVTFERSTVSNIVKKWCEWRTALEVKVIKHLISLEELKLKRLELMLLAVNNLKIIMESLSKEDSAEYLVQKLKITLEDANTILDMKVRQLKSLERKKLQQTITEVTSLIKELQQSLKNPKARVMKDLLSISQL